MSRIGRALREHLAEMRRPFVPRTLAQEEQAGYEAGKGMRGIASEHRDALIASFEKEAAESSDAAMAARARGTVLGLRESAR